MANFISSYKPLLIKAGITLLIFIGFWVLTHILDRKIMPLLKEKADKHDKQILSILLGGMRRPLFLGLRICGICAALLFVFSSVTQASPSWLISFAAWIKPFLNSAIRITIVVTVAWALISSSKVTSLIVKGARNHMGLYMSKSIQRFLSAIFSVLIAAIAIIIVLSELSFDVSALITGLGLGGLTIALAAKDTASNFFAGLVLVIEKPFDIGDWISCDIADGHIEGTVEDINLRSTMIRTGPGALTVVPNSSLGNAAITNWSGGMNKRLSDIELFFTYDTSRNSLDQYMQSVRNMLKLDPEIVADSGLVQFHSITNNGLGIKVRYYTAMPGYSDYLRIRERINFSLISLAGQYGLTFSFPTQTNIVQNKSSNEISS